MDYAAFVSKLKSMVVAPAGYGKTHAIAECLKYTEGRQLVLTHTHAGVASLKDKIQELGVQSEKYRVETITSFAQKYVKAFYCGQDVPDQENSEAYYPFLIEKAQSIFRMVPVRNVIKETYSGLFVDEYQDCTKNQHNLIVALIDILPTRILGDYLQGIFDFKGQSLVDLNADLGGFERFPDLSDPWRWKNSNPGLGNELKKIRENLEGNRNIDLNLHESHIEVMQINEQDKFTYNSNYNKRIWDLTRENNVLIIHPDSTNLAVRKDFVSRFNNAFSLVEAIDSKNFYEFSRKLDSINGANVYSVLYDLIPDLFNGTTSRDKWFNQLGVKRKNDKNDAASIAPIGEDINLLKQKISFKLIAKVLKEIKKLPDIRCWRTELFWDLCKALEQAEHKGVSVYEAMKQIRNVKRRVGRNVEGKCIGTTLLTKGLEFDVVAILDAHKFKCPKNFYVAITRACKKLIIFTNNKVFSFS